MKSACGLRRTCIRRQREATRSYFCWVLFEYAPADLISLNALEKRPEIAFAETFITLTLDQLEEDRANLISGKDLQQQALSLCRRPVDEDVVLVQAFDILAVRAKALADAFEV